MKDQFNTLSNSFNNDKYPSYQQRCAQLKKLKAGILKHQDTIYQCVNDDFGQRDRTETQIIDILPIIQSINYSLKHLKKWMKDEKRHNSWLFFSAKNTIRYQPLGVVGIISPWNYPLFLSIGPLIAALSAGNKVMLKLSEFTPKTNAIIKQVLSECLPDDTAVIEGEAEIASQFSQLPFDHILYTGSSEVGKLVMQSASKNLTPVTLELGGKSPLIIAEDANIKEACQKIMFGKLTNSGQTCVGVDYLCIPKSKTLEYIKEIQHSFSEYFQTSQQYTSIINDRHFERLNNYIKDATELGATITTCENSNIEFDDNKKRFFALTLIQNAPLSAKIWQEEIFGPILPIFSYDHISEAIDFINSRPHPLALYLFTNDKTIQKNILEQTHSGGVTINESIIHVAQDDLPFGGIRNSGIGSYHAVEGFKSFSHAKSVHQTGFLNTTPLSYPKNRDGIFKHILQFIFR